MSEQNNEPNQADTTTESASAFQPLRIWPALALLAVMLGTRYFHKTSDDESMAMVFVMVLGPAIAGLLVLVWWAFFSRATRIEKVIGVLGTILAAVLTVVAVDPTIRGPALVILTLPMGTAAFALGAVLCRKVLSLRRAWVPLLLAACGFGFSTLLVSDGMWGEGAIDWQWRWQATAEEKMLADREALTPESLAKVSAAEVDVWLASSEWPQFRGADRMSQQHGSVIETDWAAKPPEELWRISIGPGWSSFVVAGNLLFTQAQLGEQEAVVCYLADSGQEVWTHVIESRFSDPLGGPGPRATPTLAGGALFAQGASGQLQRLDPKTGELVWSQDLRKVAEREPPEWGFASSPLVVGSVVIVHAGGQGDKGILAFDVESGELRWSAAAGDHSYSSPQLATLSDETYVLMLTNEGLNLLDPTTGAERLAYAWPHQGYRVLQPPVVDGDSILLPTQELGTRRIRVSAAEGGELQAEEVWTARKFKPDFNDFVIHEGYAYGFDAAMFACVDLSNGKRQWKRGRYGKGQVLLLADSATLLVLSEAGELVLLPTDPTGHKELAKFPALEGRTWNHPVVVNDRLYIRNSREAACYRLAVVKE